MCTWQAGPVEAVHWTRRENDFNKSKWFQSSGLFRKQRYHVLSHRAFQSLGPQNPAKVVFGLLARRPQETLFGLLQDLGLKGNEIRKVWVSIRVLSAKFGFHPLLKETQNEGKLYKVSRKSSN